jgi:transcriptional regulator with XRE-family HTH domain
MCAFNAKAFCSRRGVERPAANAHSVHMAKRQKTRQFLREWRKVKPGRTLEKVAEEIGMSHQNLGKIERGEVEYTDELLELLAGIYGTDKGSLIMRDPSKADPIYSVWETLTPPQRKEALEIIEVIKRRA